MRNSLPDRVSPACVIRLARDHLRSGFLVGDWPKYGRDSMSTRKKPTCRPAGRLKASIQSRSA